MRAAIPESALHHPVARAAWKILRNHHNEDAVLQNAQLKAMRRAGTCQQRAVTST
jgi:hypothetical protein